MAKKERDDVDTGRRREKGLFGWHLYLCEPWRYALRTFEVNQKAGFAWSFLQELPMPMPIANRHISPVVATCIKSSHERR